MRFSLFPYHGMEIKYIVLNKNIRFELDMRSLILCNLSHSYLPKMSYNKEIRCLITLINKHFYATTQ